MMKFNKMIVGLTLITGISSFSFAEDWNKGNFSWESYKQTLPESIIKKEEIDKKKKTQNYIEKRHDVSVDRRTLEEIRREQRSKNLEVSALYRKSNTYTKTGLISDTEEETSNFGIGITGRFDLISIGKKLNNVYGEVDVFNDSVWMGLAKRIQSEDRLGPFVDLGTGVMFQMTETVREKDLYIFTYGRIGWNFEDFAVKLGMNIPSDAFSDGIMDKSDIMLSVGWKF